MRFAHPRPDIPGTRWMFAHDRTNLPSARTEANDLNDDDYSQQDHKLIMPIIVTVAIIVVMVMVPLVLMVMMLDGSDSDNGRR